MIIQNKNKYISLLKFFKKENFSYGYSIIEILVYLAIFTVVSILVINLFITTTSSFNTTIINRKLLEAGQMSMERVSREVRQAKNIDVANSSSDSLQMNSTNSSGGDLVVKFSSLSGHLNLYKDGILIGNLLPENINMTGLIFRRITTVHGEAVKIEMTLKYSQGNINKSENFYNTIILRGEY